LELLTTSWVVPVDRPPLREGCVAVEGGRIVWVGAAGDTAAPRGPVRELGPGVLMPGLVNAHCHLELSHLQGRIDGSAGFVGWVESLVMQRPGDPREVVRAAASRAIETVVKTGTVAVGDVSNALDHVDLLDASPLTAVVFHELIGWDPTKADALLAAAEARVAALGASHRLQIRLAAHAPHSVSPALLRGLVARGGPAAIHLAESPDEVKFLSQRGGAWPGFLARRGLDMAFEGSGLSPTQYVERLGALHPRLVAAHCVQVDAADCARLARHGVHVVLCPRSNRALGVGVAPLSELLSAGVRLSLGTDSLASVDTLDLMDDVVALHRAFPDVAAETLVRLATAGGAEALGLPDLGTIAVGKRAALARAAASRPPADPYDYLVSGEARLAPVAVS
jgi:cytosine/adenosine deaminase-related metal-dependent hydrolase